MTGIGIICCVAAVIWIISMAWFVYSVEHAQEGYEDTTGFHLGRDK